MPLISTKSMPMNKQKKGGEKKNEKGENSGSQFYIMILSAAKGGKKERGEREGATNSLIAIYLIGAGGNKDNFFGRLAKGRRVRRTEESLCEFAL